MSSKSDPYAVGEAVLECFKRHNEERKKRGAMLRKQIRLIIDVQPELSAREVLDKLDRDKLSLRTVQWHLQKIRATRRHCADT